MVEKFRTSLKSTMMSFPSTAGTVRLPPGPNGSRTRLNVTVDDDVPSTVPSCGSLLVPPAEMKSTLRTVIVSPAWNTSPGLSLPGFCTAYLDGFDAKLNKRSNVVLLPPITSSTRRTPAGLNGVPPV